MRTPEAPADTRMMRIVHERLIPSHQDRDAREDLARIGAAARRGVRT